MADEPNKDPTVDPLMDDFKAHIMFEDDMDDRMFGKYLQFARDYVRGATGQEPEQLVLMVAALLNDFRVGDADLTAGLDSLTPFFVQAVLTEGVSDDGTTSTDQSATASGNADATNADN